MRSVVRIFSDCAEAHSHFFIHLGPIPSSLGCCRFLEFLNLSGNQFSGSIPDSIGQLEDLRYLYLFDNALEGCVPVSLYRLRYLSDASFRDNRMSYRLADSFLQKGTNVALLASSYNVYVISRHLSDYICNYPYYPIQCTEDQFMPIDGNASTMSSQLKG